MAKLADALALGASGVIHGGSSPPLPTEVLGDEEIQVDSQLETKYKRVVSQSLLMLMICIK